MFLAEKIIEKRAEGLDVRILLDDLIANDLDYILTTLDRKNTQVL